MSDFLFSTRRLPEGRLAAALRTWLRPVDPELVERHGPWGSLAVARPAHEAHALHEDDDAITVVVGTPALRGGGSAAGGAAASAAAGGAALVSRGDRRARVHRGLVDPLALAPDLDGHFAALRIETGPAGAGGSVLTDRFAFVPVFEARPGEGRALLLGTHVDAVAAAAGLGHRPDLVSAADLCANLTCTFPWTLYDGVRQLEPAAARHFGPDGWTGGATTYWTPAEPDPARRPLPLREAAGRLREALRESVATALRDAPPGAGPAAALLLSGGEDSRAVLGAAEEPERIRAVTFAEWESREVRVARRVARRYGAQFLLGRRSPDHYADGFPDATRLVGSGHLFVDLHGLGLHEPLGLRDVPVVLGGLSADSLLKATYAPANPPAAFTSPRLPGLREDLLQEADRRRNAFRDRLLELRPRSADEWLQLWPLSMRKHGGNVDGNRRLFPVWEAFHATAVLDVAAAAPLDLKRHRRLFLHAVRPFLARTALVPHTEYRFPYFGRAGNAAALPFLALARGARALATGQIRARHRPWPKWQALAASAAMRANERRWPVAESPLREIFDTETGPAHEGWYALRRLMADQLTCALAVQRNP